MGYRAPEPDLEDDEDVLPVPLGPAERAWLRMLAETTGQAPGRLVAAMIHDIRVDDEAAHQLH